MSRGLWSRLTFLLYLTKEYNESHKDTKAVFHLDDDEVDFYILSAEQKDLMFRSIRLNDLTEECVYGIYKAIKETDTTEKGDLE